MTWGVSTGLFLALGSSSPATVAVDWRGPASCQEGPRVEAQLAERLGRGLDARENVPTTVVVDVEEAADGRWNARIQFASRAGLQQRELEAGDCQALAEAVALIASIAISERLEEAPAPEPPEAPAPVPAMPEPEEPPARRLWGEVGAGGVGSAGSLPGLGGGVRLELALLGPRWRLSASGRYRFATRVRREADPSQGGEISRATGALAACFQVYPRPGRIRFPICGLGEVGALLSHGFGLENARRERTLWLAAGGSAGLSVAFAGHGFVGLSGGVVAPLLRPSYVVEGDEEPVFRIGPAEIQLTVGLGYRFP